MAAGDGLVLSVLLVATSLSMAHAVRKVNVVEEMSTVVSYVTRQGKDIRSRLTSQLNLETSVGLEELDVVLTAQGSTKRKYLQTYEGLKVYNTLLHLEEDNSDIASIIQADLYTDFQADLDGAGKCQLDTSFAESLLASHFNLLNESLVKSSSEDWIFIDEEQRACAALSIKLTGITAEKTFVRLHAFIDKCTHKILEAFEKKDYFALGDTMTQKLPKFSPAREKPAIVTRESELEEDCSIQQKGGNPKRPIMYGTPGFCLIVNKSADGKTCFLENQYVRGTDLKGSESIKNLITAHFPCACGYEDEINGGYSPMLDTFFFATKAMQMFREWFNYSALSNPIPHVVAHFGKNLVNAAAIDFSIIVIGDGNGREDYPFSSADIVGHELAHLILTRTCRQHSSGLSEAFADITGEILEEYVFGQVDWMTGADVKMRAKALRYFENPSADGESIQHILYHHDSLNVHNSNGIFNHFFWYLAKVRAFGIRAAYECVLTAARLYWTQGTGFREAALGTLRGTYDSGYDMDVVADSFREVGIKPPCGTDLSEFVTAELKAGKMQTNLRVSSLRQPLFKMKVPAGARLVTVTVSSDVYLAISASYKRSSTPLATGKSMASTRCFTANQILYLRVFKDPQGDPTEVRGVHIGLFFHSG